MSAAVMFAESRSLNHRRWLMHAAAAMLLLAFGALRLPFESRLTADMHAAHFGTVRLGLGLRQQIGQLGFLSALSGFRSLVADFVWIQAYSAWERVEYGRMNLLLGTATTLQPRNAGFWDMAARYMAYDASVHAREDKRRQPREAQRRREEHDYILLGRGYVERGIANNPDARDLWICLAGIDKEKLSDHCAASKDYQRAAACPRALGFEKRFAAYELAACPGHEREAYWLLRYYHDQGERERLPTLETLLRHLEEKLHLPVEQRVYKSG